MIPGANVLNMAMSILGKQTFQYYAFQSRAENSIGQDVTVYAPPVGLRGSVQPVPRSFFQTYGLDFNKEYINVYVSKSIDDVERDMSGGKIVFNCSTYQVISKTPWAAIDGWDAALCVRLNA